MSPRYDSSTPKVGRLTILNVVFLGVNVIVGVVLVYALWRGGRALFAPAPVASPTDDSAQTAPGEQRPVLDGPASPAGSAATGRPPEGSAPGATGESRPGGAPGDSARLPAGATLVPPSAIAGGSNPGAGSSRDSGPVIRTIPTTHPATSAGPAADGASTGTRPPSSIPPASLDPRTRTPINTIPRGADRDGEDPRTDAPGPTAPAPPSIEVEPGSDRTPPVLDSIAFDPPQVNDGGASNLLIRAHDDLSGVRTVTGNIKSPSGGATFSFEAQGDSASGFVARITIPSKAETGLWYVANLYLHDRADNTLVGTFDPQTVLPGGRLNVASMQSDSAPPTVQYVSMENGSVRGGERNQIRVEASDDQSGVGTMTGVFQSPSGTATLPFTCNPDPDTTFWTGSITIPANAECGEWTVRQLRVADRAGNSATIPASAPVLARVGFGVVTEGCDSIAPTLESLELSPASVSNEAASEIVVTLIVHDEGGGATAVSGWAAGPISTGGSTPTLSFTAVRTNANDPSAPWTGKIRVPQFAARGTWKMGRVRLTDRAQNVREYAPHDSIMQGATFEVQ